MPSNLSPGGFPFMAHLAPEIPALDTFLLERERDQGTKGIGSAQLLAEALVYNLRAAWFALNEMLRYQIEVRALLAGKLPPFQQQTLGDDASLPFQFQIDLFLSSLRRAQDLCVPYISKSLRQSLPESLNSLVEGLGSKYRLDAELSSILSSYWQSSGFRVRGYRVLLQHRGQIATDCRVLQQTGGEFRFFCALPNNPEEGAADRLSYEPPVHAYPFLRDSYFEFVSFLDLFSRRLAAIVREKHPGANLNHMLLSIVFKHPLSWPPPADFGIQPPQPDELDRWLSARVEAWGREP